MFKLVHFIFEGDSQTPILAHTFFGSTVEECHRVLHVHSTWDPFLADALHGRPFQGMILRTTVRVERVSEQVLEELGAEAT